QRRLLRGGQPEAARAGVPVRAQARDRAVGRDGRRVAEPRRPGRRARHAAGLPGPGPALRPGGGLVLAVAALAAAALTIGTTGPIAAAPHVDGSAANFDVRGRAPEFSTVQVSA